MRTNLPVTDNSVELSNDKSIVSKTDLKGLITYVNPLLHGSQWFH